MVKNCMRNKCILPSRILIIDNDANLESSFPPKLKNIAEYFLPIGSDESVIMTSNSLICRSIKAKPSPICCVSLGLEYPLDMYGRYFLLTSITIYNNTQPECRKCFIKGGGGSKLWYSQAFEKPGQALPRLCTGLHNPLSEHKRTFTNEY